MNAVMQDVLLPHRKATTMVLRGITLSYIIVWTLVWVLIPWRLVPSPSEVGEAFVRLWNQGLAVELYTSFSMNVQALIFSSVVSLTVVYLASINMFRPCLIVLTKFRFMGLVGWSLAFTLMFGAGYYLKLALMVFAMSGFMATAMASVIKSIPREAYSHARTLRMSPMRVLWEVDIRGNFHQMFDIIRQNAAIGWTILTMVEGLARAEGGVGIMLMSQNKFLQLDGIFAIQLTILFIALAQDSFLTMVHKFIFPFAHLSKGGH